MRGPIPLRWVVFGIFVISSALNYLDRQVLAALAPLLRQDLGLSNTDYGFVLSAFSLTYAVSAPVAGLLIDRVGLNRGISFTVGLWSLAGTATGWVGGLKGLLVCRAALGAAQAGGVPATGKAIHKYLQPGEWSLGNAVSQMGLSAGAVLAPPLATWMAFAYGWRAVFLATGVAGFLWIPLWNWAARRVPSADGGGAGTGGKPADVLRDRRLWGFIAANVLSMAGYTLWTNWTTVYLVEERELALAAANWLAWIPPVAANLGGLLGGWLAMRWIHSGQAALKARGRVCLVSAAALLVTAGVTLMPTAGWATFAISLSIFWTSAFSVNLYSMPLDVWGGGRAAFAVSMLTGAYGAMQTVVSPAVGMAVDRYGFSPVCLVAAVLPLAGYGMLVLTRERA